MDDLRRALILDAILVVGSVLVLLRANQARMSHPGLIYVAVHAYIVTLRGWALVDGAQPFLGVELFWVAKAVIVADLFLVSAVVGWLSVSSQKSWETRSWPVVSSGVVRAVSAISIPVGLFTLLAVGYVPGVGTGSTIVTTSYQVVAVLWPALALIAFIYVRGFKAWLLCPLFAYLMVLSLQGHSRFRVLIPLILLLLIYLDTRDRRWPQLRFVIVGLVVVAFFIPMKQIGLSVREGNVDFDDVARSVRVSTAEATQGTNREQSLLDQAGITIRLAEGRDAVLKGSEYLALLTLPVPRPWWPEKPGLGDHLKEISTPQFPLAEIGAVTGLPGDLFLNFRWWGVIFGGLMFGWFTGWAFLRAYAAPRAATARFTYLLLAACMVQISRDGPVSIVVFTLVNATPWLVIAWLSLRAARQVNTNGKHPMQWSIR